FNPVQSVLGFTNDQSNAWTGGIDNSKALKVVVTGIITNVSGGSTQAITITSPNHGPVTGQSVYIQGVTGVALTGVTLPITKIDDNPFRLNQLGNVSIPPDTTANWVLPVADMSVGGLAGATSFSGGLNLLGDPAADIVISTPSASSNQISVFPGNALN